jgi:curved DNA-binding protein CbpA
MNPATAADPFTVLGLSRDANEAEIRARYLALIKQFTPEREPDKFREIRMAFEAAKDPLSLARRLVEPPDPKALEWSAVLAAEAQNPPRLSVNFLLSLGNRARGTSAGGADANRKADHPDLAPRQPRDSASHEAVP